MTSFLIISEDKKAGYDKAILLCEEKKIDQFDITVFDIKTMETKSGAKKSWGIDDIKELQKKVFLKPLRGNWKAIILQDAEILTTEAQNALLKLLEEPPPGTILILIAGTQELLLPTIISRCFIVRLTHKIVLSHADQKKYLQEIADLKNASVGQKLKKAEVLSRSKEDSLTWLGNVLVSLHPNTLTTHNGQSRETLRRLQETYATIKSTNANLRLTLEQVFLTL